MLRSLLVIIQLFLIVCCLCCPVPAVAQFPDANPQPIDPAAPPGDDPAVVDPIPPNADDKKDDATEQKDTSSTGSGTPALVYIVAFGAIIVVLFIVCVPPWKF